MNRKDLLFILILVVHFFFLKKYNKAIESLNNCINAYRVFEYEQKTYDVIIRREVVLKKVKNIKRLISLVENGNLKNYN